MAFHKPRFRLIHLSLLIGAIAVELAALPASFSWVFVVWTCLMAGLAAVSDSLTKTEWAVIAAIFALLVALLAPSVKSSHHGRRSRPSTTSLPAPGKI